MRPAIIAASALLVLPATAAAGDGGFGPAKATPADRPYALAAGDFNRDGRPDLAVVAAGSAKVEVLINAPGGGFTPAAALNPALKEPRQVVVGDFNADGNDDLAVGSIADNRVAVRIGSGTGGFFAGPDVPLPRAALSLAVADVNADGREDLVAGTYDERLGRAVAIRLGDGKASFADGGMVKDAGGPLAVGDFNGDTNEDVAVGGSSAAATVLLGRGGGVLEPGTPVALASPADSANTWAAADFDGDARQDLVAGLRVDRASVRLGTGAGTFTGGGEVAVGKTPRGVAVGDFNGDGHEDFAMGDYASARVSVRLGDGKGGFTAAPDVRTGGGPADVVAADFDGDGTDDLAVATSFDGAISVHHGTGAPARTGNLLVNGGFEGAVPSPTPDSIYPVPGWQRSGGATFIRYGFPSHALLPSRVAAPRFATGGNSLLWGGRSVATQGVTTVFQTVDVASSSAAIDERRVTAKLSAYLGGALAIPDAMSASAEFLSADGAVLGDLRIGPVTPADRRGLTTLLRRAGSAPVPARTRSVRVTLRSDDADASYSSATADNVDLRLEVGPARPDGADGGIGGDGAGPPPPPPPPRAFGAKTLVALKASRGRQLVVRVRNANDFAVTGTLRASAGIGRRVPRTLSGRHTLAIGAGATEVVRLPVRRKLRRAMAAGKRVEVRFTAKVRDPAGTARELSRTLRLRPR